MINKAYIPEAVILAKGEYPSLPLPLQLLEEARYVVCCDGAANDSLSPENRVKYADLIQHIPDQETNDQTKAVHYLQKKGVRNIAIVGATGKREDHTLGNISLLIDYMRSGIEVRMFTDYGVFIPIQHTQTFASQVGQQVSIFNFNAKGLRGEGLFYPLSDFNNWWQGTLNEATANEFTIHCTGEYLIFLTY